MHSWPAVMPLNCPTLSSHFQTLFSPPLIHLFPLPAPLSPPSKAGCVSCRPLLTSFKFKLMGASTHSPAASPSLPSSPPLRPSLFFLSSSHCAAFFHPLPIFLFVYICREAWAECRGIGDAWSCVCEVMICTEQHQWSWHPEVRRTL